MTVGVLDEARRLIRTAGLAEAEAIERLLTEAEGVPETEIDARITRGSFLMNLGQYEEALEVAADLSGRSEPMAAGQGANLEGSVRLQQGDYSGAFDAFHLALSILPQEEVPVRARVENNLGLLSARIGQLEGAAEHYTRAAEAFEALDLPKLRGHVLANLGIVQAEAGDLDGARETYMLADELLADHAASRSNVLGSLADLGIQAGRFRDAEVLLAEALRLRERLGQGRQLCVGNMAMALALLGQNRVSEARVFLEKGQALAESMAIEESRADGLSIESKILAAEGDFEGAYERQLQVAGLRDVLRKDELQRRVVAAQSRTVLEEARRDAERRRIEAEQLRDARDAAEAALRARAAFVATTSHELRGPLTAVLGSCELLALRMTEPEHRELVQLALTSAELLKTVVGDVLELSRLDAGRVELREQAIDLRELVLQTCQMAELGGDVPVRLLVADGVPELVRIDAARVRQILLNLVSNGVKYTAEGEVSVVVAARGDVLRFDVIDTGPGVPEGFVDKLFEPFTRARTSHVRSRGGTGLGLSICRRLAEAMGGRALLVSTSPAGSHFAAELPLRKAEPGGGARQTWEPVERMVVLLVEDDLTVARVVVSMLGVLGHEVEHVENAEEAHGRLEGSLPDLVISDHRMPGQTGLELAQRWAKHVRFMLLSGETSRTLADQASACGVERVIAKPVRLDTLRWAIDRP